MNIIRTVAGSKRPRLSAVVVALAVGSLTALTSAGTVFAGVSPVNAATSDEVTVTRDCGPDRAIALVARQVNDIPFNVWKSEVGAKSMTVKIVDPADPSRRPPKLVLSEFCLRGEWVGGVASGPTFCFATGMAPTVGLTEFQPMGADAYWGCDDPLPVTGPRSLTLEVAIATLLVACGMTMLRFRNLIPRRPSGSPC